MSKKALVIVYLILIGYTATLLTSCSGPKKVSYFQDIPDSLQAPVIVPLIAYTDPKIVTDDILNISVQTIDQTDVTKTPTAQAITDEMSGYRVDRNGEVEVPLVGHIKVAGLTTAEAKEVIRERAKKFYVDPVVNLKFANRYINVMGEVLRSGRIPLPAERISIVDALALAGDLGIQGKRDNILLIRDEDGKKVCVRFNMNSTHLFQSPYYYIKSGDYIYVEPNRGKSRSANIDPNRDRYISYITSFVSLTAVVFSIIINANNLSKK